MSISAVEGTTMGMFGPVGPGEVPAAKSDKDMFLQLLVAQMRYQDPMNPTDSSQFLAQSAQFTALEKMQAVADQTSALLAAQVAFGAAGRVGREVTYLDEDGATATGVVTGVTFGAEGPVLDVGDVEVPLGAVQSVASPSSPTETTTETTTA